MSDQIQSIIDSFQTPEVSQPTQNDPIQGIIDSFPAKKLSTNSQLPQVSAGNSSWKDFVDKAKDIAKQENYPASVLLGQAALETGRGTSSFAKNRNNYFGYQAYDSNPDAAKGYATPEQSISDYINLIKNTPRYAGAYNQWLQDHNDLALLQGIKNAGYATDRNYVAKVSSMPEFQQNEGGVN